MEKQTAVEWLVQEVSFLKDMNFDFGDGLPKDIINKAKEMEKAQIIKAHGNKKNYTNQIYPEIITGEQYYNETYGKE